MTESFYHGGVDGLFVGDKLQPGHNRRHHQGCKWCEARAAGGAYLGMDGPSEREAVYFTTNRLYAKFHASLFGYGDLYRVDPVGEVERSTEDSIETFTASSAVIVAVLDRAVLLTNRERRRLNELWAAADQAVRA